jgi:purine-cytosine permease-like protein
MINEFQGLKTSSMERLGGAVKKIMGFVWMIIAPVIIFLLISGAINNIGHGTKDINKPIPWIIIISIFTPIAAGLMIFGYYAVKGEYDKV